MRARDMTVTDAKMNLITKTHWTIHSTTFQVSKNLAPQIPSNNKIITGTSLLEMGELVLTMQEREVIPQILFSHLTYRL